jgi:predicted ATPase/DNA-binding CsgD family transcriptional regulator
MASGANLPLPPTPLLGREPEIMAIDEELGARSVRLLTLTGPPGVGKTRLAIAAADRASARFANGTVFVDLTSIRSAGAVVGEVARAVGLGSTGGQPIAARLSAWLSDKDLLLVVDNVEHVLPAAPDLAALLGSEPGLRLLVTSRERLHVASEHEFPVPPLPMPRRGEVSDLRRLAENPSIALLVDRARALIPGLSVTADNALALVEICIRLDGIPLAIELAAARLKVFSPEELVDRLQSHLSLLAGGAVDLPARHRTLRAAIDWSHELLPAPERVVFRRASVFVGGWTLGAEEQVCAENGIDILAVTSSLLDKSLIRRTTRPDGTVEFSMTEGVREFAAQQLLAHGEVTRTTSAHATHFAEHAGRAEQGVGTADETQVWEWVGHEQGNLLAAFGHCLTHRELGLALQLAGALGWYWYTRGRIGEGEAALEQVLALVDNAVEPVPADAFAGVLVTGGILALSRGDLDRSQRLLEQSRAVTGAHGDQRRSAIAEAFLGHVARAAGRYEEAATHYRRAGELSNRAGNARGVTWSSWDLGMLARDRGDLASARALFGTALRQFRDMDYPWAVASSAWGLGSVLVQLGEIDDGAPLLAESLGLYLGFDDRRGCAQCFEAMAAVAFARSMYQVSARLLSVAVALRVAVGVAVLPQEQAAIQVMENRLADVLPTEALDQARFDGRTMPLAAAVELANSVAGKDAASPWTPDPPLTRREHQVAALVAVGKTNRQVARSLGIAEKTAEAHVYNLMGKLGAHSRAEVASWATAEGLLPARYPPAGAKRT